MKRLAKIALTALMLTGGSAATAIATSAPAQAGVAIGVNVGGPAYWGGRYYGYRPCANPDFRYWHPYRCGVAPRYYGPAWAGYYDSGFWGPGYYQPVVGGFWFTDSWGHRRWHGGDFGGYGFHRGAWHQGWNRWQGGGRGDWHGGRGQGNWQRDGHHHH